MLRRHSTLLKRSGFDLHLFLPGIGSGGGNHLIRSILADVYVHFWVHARANI